MLRAHKGTPAERSGGVEREAAPEFGDRDALSNASSLHDLQQIGTRVDNESRMISLQSNKVPQCTEYLPLRNLRVAVGA